MIEITIITIIITITIIIIIHYYFDFQEDYFPKLKAYLTYVAVTPLFYNSKNRKCFETIFDIVLLVSIGRTQILKCRQLINRGKSNSDSFL